MFRFGNSISIWSSRIIALFLLAMTAQPLTAHPKCNAAAKIAATESGIPIEYMRLAAARHGIEPHPLMVTVDGKHSQFASIEAAKRNVFFRFLRGERSFRIGCFNIAYASASQDFASIEAMFDPVTSGRWLGRELARLRSIYPTWPEVISTYQARDLQLAWRPLRCLGACNLKRTSWP